MQKAVLSKICICFFLLIFFSGSHILYAQERVLIKGQVVADSLNNAAINIINLNLEKGTSSNPDGGFEIMVRENDSLLFSSVQFQNRTIKITKEILDNRFLKVRLSEEMNELEEVRISNIDFTGNLSTDLDKIKLQKPFFIFPDKPLPTITERKLSSLSHASDPVGAIYGLISGERKRLKKAVENEKLTNFILQTRNLISDRVLTQVVKIPGNAVMDFLYYCAEDPKMKIMVRKNQQLELIEFFKQKRPGFAKIRGLD